MADIYLTFKAESYLPKVPAPPFAVFVIDLWRNDEVYCDQHGDYWCITKREGFETLSERYHR